MRAEGRESFEAWAQARQQDLLGTAYLVTGDPRRAEDLVRESLVRTALRWDTLRDGDPDDWVRADLLREHGRWGRPPVPAERDLPELPPTRVAEGAWPTAQSRARERRRLTVAVVGVGAAAVITLAALHGPSIPTGNAPRVPETPFVVEDPSRRAAVTLDDLEPMPPLFADATWARMLDDAERVDPRAGDVTPLSEAPIDHAVLAVTHPDDPTDVLLLTDDLTWRRVDRWPGGGRVSASGRSVLHPRSFSPGGDRLALPQPGGVIVVDLRSGSSRRWAVGGPGNSSVVWPDEQHVLVADAERAELVDVATGRVRHTDDTASTAFAPDSQALTWGTAQQDLTGGSTLLWADGLTTSTLVNNSAALAPLPPLVSSDVVVGQSWRLTAHGVEAGVVVIDRSTGAPLAHQPTVDSRGDPTQLLGWSEDDRVVLGLVNPKTSSAQLLIVAWDWQAGELDPLYVVPGFAVAWGRPAA